MMTGFSTAPLQLASLIGFGCTLFGLAVFLYVFIRYCLEGSVPGFPFLASIIAIFSGAQLFALGVIGEYLARMHFRTMNRPVYAIREIAEGEHSQRQFNDRTTGFGGDHGLREALPLFTHVPLAHLHDLSSDQRLAYWLDEISQSLAKESSIGFGWLVSGQINGFIVYNDSPWDSQIIGRLSVTVSHFGRDRG